MLHKLTFSPFFLGLFLLNLFLISSHALATPATPVGLTIKKVTDDIAILSWLADDQVQHYEIRRNNNLLDTVDGNVTGYIDSNLTPVLYQYQVIAVDAQGNRSNPAFASINLSHANSYVSISLKALLQGAYDATTENMKDDLRLHNRIPLSEPYSNLGHEISISQPLNTNLFDIEGDKAIIDWVLFELRDKNDPSRVISNITALLQSNGELADPQTGSNILNIAGVSADDYFIALRHRNHLGIMTAQPIPLSSTTTLVDFTDINTPVFGKNARLLTATKALMWAGDANHDGKLIAMGSDNDVNNIFSDILLAPNNVGFNSNFILAAYGNSDINLDGNVILAGADNDTNIVQGNILLHPNNTSFSYNFIAEEQLAK